MNIVLADTNGLLSPFQFGYNLDLELGRLLGEYVLFVPVYVISELNGLANSETAGKKALNYVMKIDDNALPEWASSIVIPISDNMDVDAALLEWLKQAKTESPDVFLLTNDKELRDKAHDLGVKVIILKGSNHLEFYR